MSSGVDLARVRTVFEAVVELAEVERAAALEVACAGDHQLRMAVEQLLANDPGSEQEGTGARDTLLDAVESLAGAALDPGLSRSRRLGPYAIERELGRGGMGTVYLARRSDQQYQQLVAIKVTPRLAGAAAEERFRQERQILALLDHPNISRLYDGGTTDDGQPYLVMEYVRGKNVIEHCFEQQLDLAQRLDLFDQICSAVDYAHQRLVVHRDLKPSNVLVAADGRPRLLDFGVAKLLDPEAIPVDVVQTSTFHRMLTPGYASPEQIRGEMITTATDVYGLGLLLYEMICGQPAQRPTETKPASLEREICGTRPKAPSSVAASLDVEGRAAWSEALPVSASRDLDLIVFQALQKNPDERYASARELSQDLERWRRGSPVSAREPTPWYLLSKFLQRHRLGAAVVAAAAIVLLAFSFALAHERGRARAEARTSRAVSDFLVETFTEVEPIRARGEKVTLLEVLEAGTDRIEAELAEQPEIRAHLQGRLGDIFATLSEPETALPLQEKSVAAFRRLAPGSAELSDRLNGLGGTLRDLGRPVEAKAALEEALAIREMLGSGPDLGKVRVLNDLGLVELTMGQPANARSYFEAAIDQRARLPPEAEVDPLLLEYNLTLALTDLDMDDEAYRRLEAIVERRRASGAADHPRYLIAVKTLAQIANRLGKFEQSERLSAEAVAGTKRVYGATHKQYLDAINNAANQLHDQANFRAAETYYLQAIEVAREHGYESELPFYLNNLGALYRDMGDPIRAVDLFRQSVEIRRRVFGAQNPRTASAERNLASVLMYTGELQESRLLIEKGKDIYRATESAAQLLRSDHELGRWLTQAGEWSAAEAQLVSVLEGYRGGLRAGHPRIGRVLEDLGRVQHALGRDEEALATFEQARTLFINTFDSNHVAVAEVEVWLAACRFELGARDAVSALLGHAEPILREKHVADSRYLRELARIEQLMSASTTSI